MKKLPKGYAMRDGKPVATQDLYSEEQVKKLKNHIQRAAVLLKTVDDEHLVTVARAIVRLSGKFVKDGLASLNNPLTQRSHAIGEIACAAYPDILQPGIYKGEEVTEAMLREKGGAA